MTRKLEDIEKQLDEKIPRSAVSERDAGNGRKLSYLEGHYVIDRLNKIFGPLGWSKDIDDVRQLTDKPLSYLVKVRLTIRNPDSGVLVTCKEAYGYGSDKPRRDGSVQNPGELAMKEAATDALKVAAKDLGMSMGLALYDKSQENVEDDHEAVKPTQIQSPTQESVENDARPQERKTDTGKLKEVIRAHVKVAIKKGVLTMGQMKEKLARDFGVETLDSLSESQLSTLLTTVQQLTK